MEGTRFFNGLSQTNWPPPNPQAPCPGIRTSRWPQSSASRPYSANRDFPRILDSFAPGGHKFGHWRGRFGPRELLRR